MAPEMLTYRGDFTRAAGVTLHGREFAEGLLSLSLSLSLSLYEALGQLGQDEPAAGLRWSHCSAPLLYIGQMSLGIQGSIGTQWL